LDAHFRDHMLGLVAHVFYVRYFDLRQSSGKSIEMIGISYPFENIGRNTQKGMELQLTHRRQQNNFGYFVSGNVTLEQSAVTFFDEQQQRYPWMQLTGLPLGVRFGYIADGLFQTTEEVEAGASTVGYDAMPGDIRYRDLNGDGIINQFDRTLISNAKPRLYYGLTLGVNYRGLQVSA